MLDAGDPAPDFDLPRPTTDGDDLYRLSAATREGPAVVAFYPVADTTGAAALLRELAAVDWAALGDGLAVLGVGVGDRDHHRRLTDEVSVPFPLLLDQDGFFAERYGLLEPVDERTVRVRPALFVVGEDCFVRYAWAASDGDSDSDDDGKGEGDGDAAGSLPLDAVESAIVSS